MTDYRTDYRADAPAGTQTTINTTRPRGNGFVLFILGGVVAVLAILFFAFYAPDEAGPVADPAPAVQSEGDVNITVDPTPPAVSDSTTPEAAPAAPAPAAPATQP